MAAIIVSCLAIALAGTSLAWQVVSWRRARPAVKVRVNQTLPMTQAEDPLWYTTVSARNVGRTAVTVVGWGLRFPGSSGSIRQIDNSRYASPMPYRLEPGSEAAWMMKTVEVKRLCREKGFHDRYLRAFIRLADGTTVSAPWRLGGTNPG